MKSTVFFLKLVWKSAKIDLLLAAPWLPLYSLVEVSLALAAGILLQLVFISAPTLSLSDLLPGNLQHLMSKGRIFERDDLIILVPCCIVILALIKLLASFMSTYLTERAGHRVSHRLREDILLGFLRSPGNQLDHKNPDVVANGLMQDTALLQGAISKGTVSAVRDMLVLLGIILSMMFISWQVFVVGLLVIIPISLGFRLISSQLNYYTREGQKKQIQISTRLLQTHFGALTVHALRSQNREHSDIQKENNNNYAFMHQSLFVRTFFPPAMEFLAIAFLAVVFYWKMNFYQGFDEAGTYSSLFILLALSFRYIKNIAGTITFFSDVSVVLDRIHRDLTQYEKSHSAKRPAALAPSSQHAVEAQAVSYTSSDGSLILKDCSIKIPRGQRVAFVGESGAGKTTFLRTLAGLIYPSQGRVSTEPQMLLASQTPYVFRGTVKDNIIYSTTDIPTHIAHDKCKELILALRLAYSSGTADVFLEKKLGFLGEGLSGGEKARVGLARLLYAHPKLVFLDEPTANLDATSSHLFWKAIDAWHKKDSAHTVVTVTHSLHEVADFDICYVFSEGRIIKQGSPKEILGQSS